jgi:hypothetical protein
MLKERQAKKEDAIDKNQVYIKKRRALEKK